MDSVVFLSGSVQILQAIQDKLLVVLLDCHHWYRIRVQLNLPPSGLLRDIQARPLDMIHHRAQDTERLALFPNLDYLGLHQALVALVDVMPLIQSGTQGRSSRECRVSQNSRFSPFETFL